ncbi:MAG: alpha/beta fold hydrolase [Beijerinckiaceae bacterium]
MAAKVEALDICGVETSVATAGNGPAILILEGANNVEGWLPLYDSLAKSYMVCLPTHPGYTGSGPAPWLDSVSDLANYYLDFLEVTDLRDVHLVGLSLGGWIAADLAIRNASRIASVTLVDAMGVYLPGCEPLDIFLRSDAQFIEDLFHAPHLAAIAKAKALDPANEDRLLNNKVTTAKLTWEPRFYDPDLRKWLHRINVPTQIVWGEQDRILPKDYASEWARLIPGARVSFIPNCGHVPQWEAPAELESIIRSFIAPR